MVAKIRAYFLLTFLCSYWTSIQCATNKGSTVKCSRPWQNARLQNNSLYIGVLDPGNEIFNSSIWPAIELALDDVQKNSCTLIGYKLRIIRENTQCKPSRGLEALFTMMHDSPTKIALFGASCTAVNEPVAMAAGHWNILQLSYHETHPKFSITGDDNPQLYHTFYRIIPGVLSEQRAQLKFIKKFNWTRFGMVTQKDDERYNLPHAKFITKMETEKYSIVQTQGFSGSRPNYKEALAKLVEDDARIIFADFNLSFAGGMFCEAYKAGLYGPQHVWMLTGQPKRIDVVAAAKNSGCTYDELNKALKGHFIFDIAPMRSSPEVQPDYKKMEDYKKNYTVKCAKYGNRCRQSGKQTFDAYAYDGIWALALAADRFLQEFYHSEQRMYDPGKDNFQYSSWTRHLKASLNDTVFEGITGTVKFEDNERLGLVRIVQYDGTTYNIVGEYDAAWDNLTFVNETRLFFWTADGGPPPDTVRTKTEQKYIDEAVFYVMWSLTSVGIIVALCFLFVNIYFRNHRFIKMSSPYMNNLIIVGSILTYVSVVLLGIDTRMASEGTYNVLCTAKIWILCSGFSLAFGSMFSKTWRVHSIFTNIKLNKKAIKDYQLFLIVCALFLIDGIIMIVMIFVSPMYRQEMNMTKEDHPELNLVILPIREYCASEHMAVFQGLLFGYKGILLILGCFLAWETRHVNVPALNDSKYVGMSVYNVVLMCALGVAILLILESRVTEAYILISLFIIFCTTLTLCLVFVPKIVELARSPKGGVADKRYRQTMMKSVGTLDRKLSDASIQDHRELLMRAEQDNVVWRKMLDEKSSEIAQLLKSLQEYGEVTADLNSLPKENTSQFSHSSVPEDPFGGVYLGPSGPSFLGVKQQPQQQQQQQMPSLSPSQLKSPTEEEASETTSLLQRPNAGSFRDKLSKLRTSISRSSIPTLAVATTVEPGASSSTSNGNNITNEQGGSFLPRSGSSMYQSLRELSDANEAVSNDRSLGKHRDRTKHASDSTNDNHEDSDDYEDESTSSSTSSSSARAVGRRVEADYAASNSSLTTSTTRTLSSTCAGSSLTAINQALSTCDDSTSEDEDDELLDDGDNDIDDEELEEEDALL